MIAASSPALMLRQLAPDRQAALLRAFTPAEIEAIEYDWAFWARASQRTPPGTTWSKWLALGGRGGGKTRTAVEFIREERAAGARRIALVGATAPDVRDVMIEGESGILACSPRWDYPRYEPSKRRLTWSTGAIATAYSADEPERLRGPQHDCAWGDELAAWRYPEAYDQLMFGLRLGKRPRAVFSTTPKPLPLILALIKDPTVVVTRMPTADNIANLAPSFISEIVGKYRGTRLGRQELDAEILEEVDGALWNVGLIERSRMTPEEFAKAPSGRTVVAIDPSVSSSDEADECGVIAVMRGSGKCPCGKSDCAYVLRDASGKMPPIAWARAGIGLYRELMADRLVAEVNNGGDLVEAQLRVVDSSVSYVAVHAAKAKRTRAEPVQALYEQGRVHHVGGFPQLEDELCMWVPDAGMPSPGRLDALVWALTELALNETTGLIDYYAQLNAANAAPQ